MSLPADLPEIPQRELRNEVSRVLREVRDGGAFTITVDGAPVADLVPHRSTRRRQAVPKDELIEAFKGLKGREYDNSEWIDDSWYDPYDRAYRRGEFAAKDGK